MYNNFVMGFGPSTFGSLYKWIGKYFLVVHFIMLSPNISFWL